MEFVERVGSSAIDALTAHRMTATVIDESCIVEAADSE
jgi:hypothetical protein